MVLVQGMWFELQTQARRQEKYYIREFIDNKLVTWLWVKNKMAENIGDIENEAEENMYKRKLLDQESHR